MIAVDTNILVQAHRGEAEFHGRASRVISGLAEGGHQWAIPWPCVHEFLAVITHARIFDPPTPVETAIAQVTAWLESPTLVLLGERIDHWAHLARLVLAGAIRGPAMHDARIAALCVEHGVSELWTADRDFSRFPRLAARNPLID